MIERPPRPRPSRKRYDEKDAYTPLPNFEVRPHETLIPTLDLRELVNSLPNEGDE